MFRWRMGYGLVLLALLSAALLTQTTSAPALAQRATLPPTWTPTFTATVTHTPTPTTTPTLTPTLSPAEVCETEFFVVDELGSGYYYEAYQYFTLLMGTERRDTFMRAYVYHRLSGEGVGVDIPPQAFSAIQLPISELPRPGLYDWELTLLSVDEQEICQETGYFFAGRPEWVTPSPLPPTEPTPLVIVVTATPMGTAATPAATATQPAIREREFERIPPTRVIITPDAPPSTRETGETGE